MAQFYGTVNGATRTIASRRGHKLTGLSVSAQSYAGSIYVRLYHRERDYAYVTLEPHASDAVYRVVLFDGPCDAWRTHMDAGVLGRAAWDATHRGDITTLAKLAPLDQAA